MVIAGGRDVAVAVRGEDSHGIQQQLIPARSPVACAAAWPTFGDIHGPEPHKFIGFGDIHGPKPYKFIGFGDIDIHGTKLYKFIRFGDIHGPKLYKFTAKQKQWHRMLKWERCKAKRVAW